MPASYDLLVQSQTLDPQILDPQLVAPAIFLLDSVRFTASLRTVADLSPQADESAGRRHCCDVGLWSS